MSYTYGQLSQKSDDYEEAIWRELDDLYVGGYRMKEKCAAYLPEMVGERPERHKERLKSCSYINYIGEIVDAFVANVFSQEISVAPVGESDDNEAESNPTELDGFYKKFQRDADMAGNPFDRVIRRCMTNAILKKRALLAVDFPLKKVKGDPMHKIDELAPVPTPASLADEDALGMNRAYVFEIPIESMLDWEMSADGYYEWCVLHKAVVRRNGPSSKGRLRVDQFKVWTLTGSDEDTESRKAYWETWETEPYDPTKQEECPTEDTVLKRTGSGLTSFDAIPILELNVPDGLWVGNKCGPMALEHFQRRSCLVASQNRSLFVVPYVKLASEIGAPGFPLPSEAQQNPARMSGGPAKALQDKGYMVMGGDDDAGFLEPSGDAYVIIDGQLQNLANEMFRVVHQMANSIASTNTGNYRSGKSKIEDRQSMEIVLGAYGSIVRQFTKQVFDFISRARGESTIWQSHGMDTYELEDREILIKEAAFVETFDIPSETFKKQHKTKIAFALLGPVSTDIKSTIRAEIDRGVEKDMRHDRLEEKMNQEQIKAGMAEAQTQQKQQEIMKNSPGAGLSMKAPAGLGTSNAGPLLPADDITHHPHRGRRQGKKKNVRPRKSTQAVNPSGKMSLPAKPE